MEKKFKLMFTFMAMLCLTICFGINVSAKEVVETGDCGAEGDNVVWTLYDDGELVIGGDGEMMNYTSWDSPFYRNYDIRNIVIEYGVTSIGDLAFFDCRNVESISLSDSVISIGQQSFYWCEKISSIYIPKAITNINNKAFVDCRGLTAIIVDEDNEYYSNDENGVLFDKEKNVVIYYPVGNNRTSYIIPTGVTNIGFGAFDGAINLASIVIPNSVETIEGFAFNDCMSLNSIVIPEGVTTIEWCAFQSCTNLKWVKLPESLTTVGDNVFSICVRLESVSLPRNLSYIGEGLFNYCLELNNVFIPDTITQINEDMFRRCESLKDVYYTGNQNDWDKIVINNENSNNDHLLNATVHFNSVACNHVNKENVGFIQESCIIDGYTEGVRCKDCGEWLDGRKTIVAKHINDNDDQYCDRCEREMPVEAGFCGSDAPENYSGDASVKYYLYSDGTLEIYGSGTITFDFFSYDENIKKIIINEGIKGLEYEGFNSCYNLKSIIIPKSLTNVGKDAFDYCYSLSDVYYAGSKNEWLENIDIEDGNETLLNARIYYNFTSCEHIDLDENNLCDTCNEVLFDVNLEIRTGDTLHFTENYYWGEIYVKFEAPNSNVYKFSIKDFPKDKIHFNMNVYDKEMNHITGSVFEETEGMLDKGGPYYLKIDYVMQEDWQIGDEISFNLEAQCLDLPYCRFIDNNSDWICDICGESMLICVDETCNPYVDFGEKVYIRFVPTKTGKYTLSSLDDWYSNIYLYDSALNELVKKDDEKSPSMTYEFEEGKEYYWAVGYDDSNTAGVIPVALTFNKELENNPIDDLIFTFDSNTLCIYGAGNIPELENSSDYPWSKHAMDTVAIYLIGVNSISSKAFEEFMNLRFLMLDSEMITIKKDAFANSDFLYTVVTFGNTVVEDGAFSQAKIYSESGKTVSGYNNVEFSYSDNIVHFNGDVNVSKDDLYALIGATHYRYGKDYIINAIKFNQFSSNEIRLVESLATNKPVEYPLTNATVYVCVGTSESDLERKTFNDFAMGGYMGDPDAVIRFCVEVPANEEEPEESLTFIEKVINKIRTFFTTIKFWLKKLFGIVS
jgi:hypothetical protein